MAIIRSKREARFTVINNCVFERNKLSWSAMGMLGYLLSKPDNWCVSVAELIKTTDGTAKKSGRDAVYAILDELMLSGFVTRSKQANGNMDYTVFDEPVTDNPYYGKDVLREIPITEKPDTDNPTLISTERTPSTDKKLPSTDIGNPSQKAPSLKKGSRLSEDWKLSEENARFAADRGFDEQETLDMALVFKNHWLSKAGAGATKLDWDKTWQNWVINSFKKPKTKTAPQSLADKNRAAVEAAKQMLFGDRP